MSTWGGACGGTWGGACGGTWGGTWGWHVGCPAVRTSNSHLRGSVTESPLAVDSMVGQFCAPKIASVH